MQDLDKIWSSCIETLGKNNIVEDKIILEAIFGNATLETINDNQVIITTDLKWNINSILEKKMEIESILSNSFSKQINIRVMTRDDYAQTYLNKKTIIESHLHPDMTFDNFVVGNSNKMAQSAALLVSTNPGDNFNPLFIYGASGLGKTHLMQAIGHYIIFNRPDLKVRYIRMEDYFNEWMRCFQHNDSADNKKYK